MLPFDLRQALFGLAVFFAFHAEAQVAQRGDAVGKLLNEWYQAGTAAGLAEIYYENRDGQHSPLNVAQYPQLQVFQADAKTGPDKGPSVVLRAHPTVGNCSMSAPAEKGGSLPRMYQVDPKGQKFLMMQYLANNLMIYPEHQDYDIGGNGVDGYGDLYPSNNACSLISQGSSGSDQPFLNAVLTTIAAFPPDTQRTLIDKRILMPTVQAILRQSNKQVKKEADYFTGVAHPVVFDAGNLDEEKMIQMAHDMRPPMIPPLVQIEVVEETELKPGKDYFETDRAQLYKLADTPVSVARILRSNSTEYTMVLSAKKSADILGRPIQLRWQLLQGDSRLIKLETNEKEPVARLHIKWQPPAKTATGIRSYRVDIGVFASNGISTSAPAIVSFYMLPNEMHFYDSKGRVTDICYQTHNPEAGLPVSPRDPRWMKAMLALSLAGDGLRSVLAEKLLMEPERLAIQKAWLPLNEEWLMVQKLEADPEKKDQAEQLKKRVLDDLEKALSLPLPGERGLTVRSAIERSLSAISGFTDLFFAFQRDVLALAAKSSKAAATADIASEVMRLKNLGILMEKVDGSIALAIIPTELTPAERYCINGLNLTIMSQALYPDVLVRSTAPAWVDPRLSTPKAWRDVNRYDEAGLRQGWIRYQAGRTYWFDNEGRYLPEGPKQADKAQPVIYESHQGVLEWCAK